MSLIHKAPNCVCFVPRACLAHMAVFPGAVFACNDNQDLHKEEWDIFAVTKMRVSSGRGSKNGNLKWIFP